MGAKIKVYIDPGSPTKDFDLVGPHIFGFESEYVTNILCGVDPIGIELFNRLDPHVRELLEPKAHVFESKLERIDPRDLTTALMKFYELATQFIYVSEEVKEILAKNWSTAMLFVKLQREIAGSIFICKQAQDHGKYVYWALG